MKVAVGDIQLRASELETLMTDFKRVSTLVSGSVVAINFDKGTLLGVEIISEERRQHRMEI
jgi:hypothetical protein